jgi:DNA-directed RNA polymerase omega subunit
MIMKKAHEISTEQLCEKIPNKFEMILVASLRTRELSRQNVPNPVYRALSDILENKVDKRILDKLKDKKTK